MNVFYFYISGFYVLICYIHIYVVDESTRLFWFSSLAGISRSVTIVAAYIISVTGLSVAEALQAVRSTRTIANPNFGFQKQLYDYFEVNAGAQKVSCIHYTMNECYICTI